MHIIKTKTAYIYSKDGDIFYKDNKTGTTRRITETIDSESNPQFSFQDTKIVFNRGQNLYAWNIATGETQQLTNLKTASATPAAGAGGARSSSNTSKSGEANEQENWLKKDQLQYFEVLRSRKEKKERLMHIPKHKQKELRSISIEDKILQGLNISPDGRFISYRLNKPVTAIKTTIVPNYVTETGFTTDIPARTKVGDTTAPVLNFLYMTGNRIRCSL